MPSLPNPPTAIPNKARRDLKVNFSSKTEARLGRNAYSAAIAIKIGFRHATNVRRPWYLGAVH